MNLRARVILGFLAATCSAFGACGDDDSTGDAGAGTSGGGAGKAGSSGKAGSAGSSGSSGTGRAGGSGGIGGMNTAGNDAGSASAAERGKYIVEHVAVCGDCHTPRKMDGSFDTAKLLAGVDCFVDSAPADPDVGCLSSRNLTNDETGLKNRSDQEIKDMFLKGERPADSGGKPTALHPIMPYWVFGNMSDADADAVVAYLRTVPGVNHRVAARQMPFEVDMPVPRFPEAKIPMPVASYSDRAAAMRGRYLAGNIGICLECHTGRDDKGAVKVDMAFQGGDEFRRDALRLPPVFPSIIYSANITPDATGIKDWSVQDVVNALKKGEDKDQMGAPLCPPMPAGPMGAFGGLTDDDAKDIGHYLLSIPPGVNMIPMDCIASPPGDPDAGADAG
jgi:mono/diheme cytochrome c family protein